MGMDKRPQLMTLPHRDTTGNVYLYPFSVPRQLTLLHPIMEQTKSIEHFFVWRSLSPDYRPVYNVVEGRTYYIWEREDLSEAISSAFERNRINIIFPAEDWRIYFSTSEPEQGLLPLVRHAPLVATILHEFKTDLDKCNWGLYERR